IRGRKRQIIVDTLGNLLRVWVHAADMGDREAAFACLELMRGAFPQLLLLYVGGGYTGELEVWAKEQLELTIEVVKKVAGQQGFVARPKRWIVERSIAWLCRNRRLAKDHEELPECSETWIYLASIRLL